ncbi:MULTISPECIES: Arc family DNA-binding protein [Acinetobacter]|uniref:Arc-like DNA binding domain-containing protein n=1 Tax=Acinetobacter lwoffii NCTC 5866 = CIP 64.10 = NIPH 512 TaxID=981327 RepID=A0ABN0Q0R5_ACILW|nr:MULTISPECIES: Arc family DNA-binding protein [Acinetobacter]ESJ96389.1 hypothetical protein P800_01213 [Acinetobacter lwoffii NCTC 5866 = CIP 64.10 = NIPH 512]ENU16955.1 hypothetical protein F995_00575 [Acinetobacter sp. CIP A162]NGP41029.1 Arc family DNA-binding protein [Acinetobacter lwoffii]QXB40133.1 Arc family DNA-binding protein [Acinetobacter lwoffii]SUU37491.1 phage regulatory protein [Acinetobacter lwoffii]
MSNQADHTIVRLRVPPELKQKIEKSAEENNRSQSAEMVARLEQSFESAFFSDEEKAQYGKGFLSGTATALSMLYGNVLNKLEHQYTNNPTPELHLEVEKYKFLIEKLELIADNKDKSPILDEFKKAP